MTIECLVTHRDHEKCQPSWCSVGCSEADAFRWLGAYDKCLKTWEPPEVALDLRVEGPSAQAACYVAALKAHPGITDAQAVRYRAQRPQGPAPTGRYWDPRTQPSSDVAPPKARYIPSQAK